MESHIAPLITPVRRIDFAQIHVPVCLPDIQEETRRLAEQGDWVAHVNQRDYSGGWDVLPLRCQRRHIHAYPVLQGFAIEEGSDWRDLPLMGSCPAITRFVNDLYCPLKAVRLMRLRPQAHIKPHRDSGLSIECGEARLHLPIQMSGDVSFTCNHRTVPMQEGELWYIDADREHAVYNHGIEDRINLVIDCAANEWLLEKIRSTRCE